MRFRIWLSNLLQKIAFKIYNPVDSTLYKRAGQLIQAAESFVNSSSEYKRHKVYAQLVKEFPNNKVRDIAYVIELVIQRTQ